MKYLALDTSGETVTVLVGADEKIFSRICGEHKKTSEYLLGIIDDTLIEAGIRLSDLDFFACVTGPGSFTGIRVGVVTIKTFASVTGKPVIAVTSLEKTAYNDISPRTVATVCVVHAYADYCYMSATAANGTVLLEPIAVCYDEALKLIGALPQPCEVFADEISASKLPDCRRDDSLLSLKRAVESLYAAGRMVSTEEVEPFYLLKSQAERDLGDK